MIIDLFGFAGCLGGYKLALLVCSVLLLPVVDLVVGFAFDCGFGTALFSCSCFV